MKWLKTGWDFNKTLDHNMRAEEQLATVPLSLVQKELPEQARINGDRVALLMDDIRAKAIKYVNEQWEQAGLNEIHRWYSYEEAYETWESWVNFAMEAMIKSMKVEE